MKAITGMQGARPWFKRKRGAKIGVAKRFALIVVLAASQGCAVTQIAYHARGISPPLCTERLRNRKGVVHLDAAWRSDQKEVARREAIFVEGVDRFFSSSTCFQTIKVIRTGANSPPPDDATLIRETRSAGGEIAILLRIEELGPNLILYLSPILWQTRNEVLLRVRIIDARNGTVLSDTSGHRFRGGPFTLFGVRQLPDDLDGLLRAMFYGKTERSMPPP